MRACAPVIASNTPPSAPTNTSPAASTYQDSQLGAAGAIRATPMRQTRPDFTRSDDQSVAPSAMPSSGTASGPVMSEIVIRNPAVSRPAVALAINAAVENPPTVTPASPPARVPAWTGANTRKPRRPRRSCTGRVAAGLPVASASVIALARASSDDRSTPRLGDGG